MCPCKTQLKYRQQCVTNHGNLSYVGLHPVEVISKMSMLHQSFFIMVWSLEHKPPDNDSLTV